MGGTMQAHPQEPPEVYSNLLPPSVGETTGGKQPIAPQVNVPILGWKIAGTSAGATGGKLKSTPAVEAIAPQVDVSTAGKHRPARTEDRR